MHMLGVDGGNTKTLALVARADGTVVAMASGGSADIYGAQSEAAALDEIEQTSRAALAMANVAPDELHYAAFSLAGADWPEDYAVFSAELTARLRLTTAPTIVNDALGGLWSGASNGVGVSVVCGTAGAVGARGWDERHWHAGFWIGSSGAIELVRQAVRAVNRATCGVDPPTTLAERLPAFFGACTPEEMLHLLTRRGGALEWRAVARAAPIVLVAADDGDPTAGRLVDDCGAQLADFALAAAREVGLSMSTRPFALVLTGGVLRHPSTRLRDAIVTPVLSAIPAARPVFAKLPPAVGALRLAAHAGGIEWDEVDTARLSASLRPFDTLPPASLEAVR